MQWPPSKLTTRCLLQDLVEQCGSAFGELRLRPPMPVSLRSGDAGPVFSQLLGAAQDPEPHIPLTPSLKVGFVCDFYAAILSPCRVHGYDLRSLRSCSALDLGRDRMQLVSDSCIYMLLGVWSLRRKWRHL